MARKKPRRLRKEKRRGERRNGNELNAAPRAQLGTDTEKRVYRPPADDASIEDPLHEWPEEA
jgi:hypothetical protein